jgi:hypothetical protein
MTSFSRPIRDNFIAAIATPFISCLIYMIYRLLCMIFRFAEFIQILTGVEVFISLTAMAFALLYIILRRTKNIDEAIRLFFDFFKRTNKAFEGFVFDNMNNIANFIFKYFPELPDKGGLKRNVRIALEIFILSIMILCSFTVFVGLLSFLRYML